MRLFRWFISWLKFENCEIHRCCKARNHLGDHNRVVPPSLKED